MQHNPESIYIYVDVDETFIRNASPKRIPITRIIEYIKEFKRKGAIL